jgi:hypothetical protein
MSDDPDRAPYGGAVNVVDDPATPGGGDRKRPVFLTGQQIESLLTALEVVIQDGNAVTDEPEMYRDLTAVMRALPAEAHDCPRGTIRDPIDPYDEYVDGDGLWVGPVDGGDD